MNIAENGSGSGRLAPLVQAGLAALVAGSLLSFSAIAFNDGFTSTEPEQGVAASPLETGDGPPVVVPVLPGGAISEPQSGLVAELPAGADEARRDDVLGTRLDQPEPAPQIFERPPAAGEWGDPSGRNGGTADGSGSPAWDDPRDGHSGGSDGREDDGKDDGGSSDGGGDDRDPDPDRPEAKPRDEDDEPEARDDDDDDDDEGSGGSYRVADHSAASGDSVETRSDEARADGQPTGDESTPDPEGNSEPSAAHVEEGDGYSGGTFSGTRDSVDLGDSGHSGDSGQTGDSGTSEGNHGDAAKDDEGYLPRGS